MDGIAFDIPKGWNIHEGMVYRRYGDPKPSRKLAIFDMDGTLMLTPSTLVKSLAGGMKLSAGKPAIETDYILYDPNIKEKLAQELEKGKSILICSNQSNLFEDANLARRVFGRIELLLRDMDTPLYIILAFKRDLCRKPAPGMLLFYEQNLNSGLNIDRNDSFYVGDAAGREWSRELSDLMSQRVSKLLKSANYGDKRYRVTGPNSLAEEIDVDSIIKSLKPSQLRDKFRRDFSDCDFKFAINNGLSFFTPEEYFCNFPKMELSVNFDPQKIGINPYEFPTLDGLLLLVGPPASGKTFLCNNKFVNFMRVNQDTLKTRQKCIAKSRSLLELGNNVVIDNTNPSINSRGEFIKLAKEFGVRCSVIFLNVSKDFALHFNRFRKLVMSNDSDYVALPHVAIHTYFRNLQPPSVEEGFDTVITITDTSFPVQHSDISSMHLP